MVWGVRMKQCGYCDKPLPKDNVCKEVGCMYQGARQLNPKSKDCGVD